MLCPNRLSALVFILVSGLMLAAVHARDLPPAEQQLLADAISHQDRLDAALKLAQETAGPGDATPPPSKARLAMARLESAMSAAAQVKARLEKLPPDDAGVKALQTRYDTSQAGINALTDRLTGKNAPPPDENPAGQSSPAPAGRQPTAPAAGADGVKLDYRQETSLKNARFTVREVQGRAEALSQLVASVNQVADPATLDYQLIGRGINTIEDARRRIQNANEHLKDLPPDGRGVAEVRQELDAAVAQVDAAEKVLAPIHQQLAKLVDPGSYPNFKTDLDRLREIAQMFGDPESMFAGDRARAAQVVRETPAAVAEYQRILKSYAPLMGQQTEMSRQLEGAGRNFQSRMEAFVAVMNQARQSLPGEIDASIAEVNRMADDAIANQRPAWFSGGIPQHVGFVEERVALLEAVDAEAARVGAGKLAELRASLKERESSLAQAIIAANNLPPDAYSGGDKAELVKRATDAWLKVQPDAQVLKVCIPGENWRRETLWRNQTGDWYKIDRSRLQAQVLVRQDDRLAVIRPVNLWKDHLQNDQISATPLDDTVTTPGPRSLLPLEKVK